MIIVNYFCMDSKDILLEEIAEEALACAYRFRKVVGGGIGGVIIQGGGEQAEELYTKICNLAENSNLHCSKSYLDKPYYFMNIESSIAEDRERITVYIDDKKLIYCLPNEVFCERECIYLIDLDSLIDKDEG